MPDGEDEHHTIQVREGYSGWKAGDAIHPHLEPRPAAYTLLALSKNDDLVAMATGTSSRVAETAIYLHIGAF
jgi:hypothetical protein